MTPTKICTRCGAAKDLAEFYTHKSYLSTRGANALLVTAETLSNQEVM